MLSHRNLLAMIMSFFADHYVPDETDVAAPRGPSLSRQRPLCASAGGPGRHHILHDSVGFNPSLVFEELTRWKVTLIPFLAPTQIKRLAEEPIGPSHDLASLRAIAWGRRPHVRGRRPTGCRPVRAHPDRALRDWESPP